jgi:hypothetical protein
MTCEVSPYSESYELIKDVPIVAAATAWTIAETGKTRIIYFNQILWYGQKMLVRLLNPSQMQYYGHKLCDDVTNHNQDLGIPFPDHGMTIPFTMSGTKVNFETRVPSQWESKNCNVIVMTEDSWDPLMVTLAATSSTRWTRKDQIWRSINVIQAKPIQYPTQMIDF